MGSGQRQFREVLEGEAYWDTLCQHEDPLKFPQGQTQQSEFVAWPCGANLASREVKKC